MGRLGLFFGMTQQRVNAAGTINADVAEVNFDSTGVPTQYFNVTTTGYGWALASAPSWTHGGPTTGAVGTTEIHLYANANAGAYREGILRINLNVVGKTLLVKITQQGSI